ncbi:MAG: hypothetical protein ACYC26_02360 [Phycisphaerales bacterium]
MTNDFKSPGRTLHLEHRPPSTQINVLIPFSTPINRDPAEYPDGYNLYAGYFGMWGRMDAFGLETADSGPELDVGKTLEVDVDKSDYHEGVGDTQIGEHSAAYANNEHETALKNAVGNDAGNYEFEKDPWKFRGLTEEQMKTLTQRGQARFRYAYKLVAKLCEEKKKNGSCCDFSGTRIVFLAAYAHASQDTGKYKVKVFPKPYLEKQTTQQMSPVEQTTVEHEQLHTDGGMIATPQGYKPYSISGFNGAAKAAFEKMNSELSANSKRAKSDEDCLKILRRAFHNNFTRANISKGGIFHGDNQPNQSVD